MKKQIISLLSAGILLCGLSVSALAAENADFAAASETEEAAAFAADDEVSANYPVVSDFENTATGIRVYWKAYSGAARYGLFYLGADGWHGIATTTSLNMEYENLKNGTAYTFTVRALNSSGDFISDYNRDGWSHTFMAPPVISELYSTDSGVSVSWNALKGEKKYRVYRMDDSHGWARIGDTAETTFIDKTAASGTRYSYTVRAITADGSRETTYFNPGKSIYYVAAPRVTEIVNRDGSADIYWNACKGASQYRVFWLDNGTWRGLGNTSSTRFSHSGLRNNVPTTYTVRCLDDDGDFISAYNDAGWTNTYLAPPVISSLKSTENGVEVKWNKLAGAVRYRVYRRDSSHGWARIGDTADAAWVDKTAASGNRYSYTVRAITADGSRETSYFNDGRSIYYVATPVVTEIVNRSGSAEIYWKACSGASKYRVFYYDAANGWKGLGNTNSTSFTHSGLRNGSTFTYTVRCLDSNGDFISDYNGDGWKNTYLAPPVISELNRTAEGVEVRWNKNASAVRYRVYRRDSSHGWARIGETTDASYVDKTAASGMTYGYTVRCITADSSRETSYFNDGKSIYYVSMPKITSAENGFDSVILYWNACKGASKYRVFYYDKNDGWKGLGNTTDTYFVHGKLKNNDTFTYTVRCLDGDGDFVSAYDREGFTHTFMAPPAIGSVTKAEKGNLVKWNAVDGVNFYRLYRKTPESGWSRLSDSVEGTEFADTTAKAGNLYTYTLRCMDDKGSLITSYIDDTKYYIDGKVANGTVKVNGNTYYFDNGYFRSGYQKIGGKTYYYNEKGQIEKDAIVGSASEGYTYADENGVCIESEEIKLAAKFMMEKCSGSTRKERFKYAFQYMATHFPYSRSYDHPKYASDVAPLAIDMFKNEKGNCYRYAACYACLAKIAGYRTRMCIGRTSNGSPHGWTEVLVNGTWYICDVDAQLPRYGNPAYTAYMMRSHYWGTVAQYKYELTFKDGKAVWS